MHTEKEFHTVIDQLSYLLQSTFSPASDKNKMEPRYRFLSESFLQSSLFSQIDVDQIKVDSLLTFLKSGKPFALGPGEVLCKQNETGREFFVIEEGDLDVYSGDKKIGESHRGDVVGLLTLIYKQPRSASLKVPNSYSSPKPVKLWSFDKDAFDRFVNENPKLISIMEKKRFLRHALSNNSLFRRIEDDNEKEKLVSKFSVEHAALGQKIIEKGQSGDKFYVLESGLAEIRFPTPHPNSESTGSKPSAIEISLAPHAVLDKVYPGQSFGEVALLYAVPRAATVTCVCAEGCNLFALDKESFLSVVEQGSSSLKHVFFKFAKQVDPLTNERVMAYGDFVEAVKYARNKDLFFHHEGRPSDDDLSDQRLHTLFVLADISGDKNISFAEFILLHSLLADPAILPEKRLLSIAFRLFDQDKNGSITKTEFISALRILLDDKSYALNLENDAFVNKIFGNGEKELKYEEFEQLMKHKELPSFLTKIKDDLFAINDYFSQIDLHVPISSAISAETSQISYYAETGQATKDTVVLWKTLLSGGISGAISRTAVSPIERLKLLFQMQGKEQKYLGFFQGLRTIFTEDGVRGLFRGNFTNVILITPTVAFQFFFYDIYKSLLFKSLEHAPQKGDSRTMTVQTAQRLLCGGLAGATACILTYPLDFIRARLTIQTAQTMQYQGIADGIRQVVRADGIRGLYRGLWPSVVGIFPFIGMDFAFYELFKHNMPKQSNGSHSAQSLLIAGGAAGVISQSIAYPLDLIRRRLQVQGFTAANVQYNYKGGILSTMRTIVKEEGVRGLYHGLAMNVIKVGPSISISFLVYERMREFLHITKKSSH